MSNCQKKWLVHFTYHKCEALREGINCISSDNRAIRTRTMEEVTLEYDSRLDYPKAGSNHSCGSTVRLFLPPAGNHPHIPVIVPRTILEWNTSDFSGD